MKPELLILGLIPITLFVNIQLWNDIDYLRFFAIYWQIVGFIGACIILKLKEAKE